MALGKLLTRSTVYTAENTVTGETATFTIVDNIAPDWSSSGYRGGMGIPGAWRAANMLSGLLGGLPWHAYEDTGTGAVQVTPDPPLLDQPHPPYARVVTFSSMALDYLWHGNGIAVVAARDPFGVPTAAIPVSAAMVGVRLVTPQQPSMVSSPGELEYQVGPLKLGPNDVIHVMGPTEPGCLRGMGVLESHMNTLDLASEQGRQARSISRHGVPTGMLKSTNPDATEADLKAMKTGWLKAQRDRTVAAVSATTEFEPLSWNPEELQMVEARKFTLTELELLFGLPVGWLGGQTSSRTYSNIEQDAINLLKFSLADHVNRFEQTLSLKFPPGWQVKATLDAVLRPDTLTRYQAHNIATGGKPFLTVDEVRELENRGPMPAEENPPTEETPDATDQEDNPVEGDPTGDPGEDG